MEPQARVLAYCDSASFSGAESFFSRVVRDLAAVPGVQLSCAAPHANAELVRGVAAASGEKGVIDVPAQSSFVGAVHLFDPRRRRRVAELLASQPWDVVLVNLSSPEYGGTPLLVGTGSARTVGLLHIDAPPQEAGSRLGRLRGLAAARALRRLDVLLVLSEGAGRRSAGRWTGPDTQVRVIPMPRPEVGRPSREGARAQLGLPAAGVVVGIAGRVDFAQKGHDTFMQAAADLAARRPDVTWAVAGAGPDEARLRDAIAAAGLQERFHLLGAVRPVDAFLAAVDALVIPSRLEGIPLIGMEALVAGTGGVATSIPGLVELWPEPWQVPPDDPAALAAALERYLDSPLDEREALLSAARKRVEALSSEDYSGFLAGVLASVGAWPPR